MENPTNEMEVIIWFAQNCQELGYEILSATSSSFPDAEIMNLETKEVFSVEFEYYSSSFIEHEHNPEYCKLIICWKNDFPIKTDFPIWELSTNIVPLYFVTYPKDIEEIKDYIQNVMLKRIERRKDKVYSSDWRKIRDTLNPEQVSFLAGAEPKDIVQEFAKIGISLSPRTASNWKHNAMKELGIEQGG